MESIKPSKGFAQDSGLQKPVDTSSQKSFKSVEAASPEKHESHDDAPEKGKKLAEA